MTTNESPPENTPTPTPTHYQQIAARFRAAFTDIMAMIPQLEGVNTLTAQFVRTHQNLPRAFMETVINAVDNHAALKVLNKLDVEAARDTLQFMDAFEPVCDFLDAFVKDLRYAMASRNAVVAVDCLQVYGVSKHLARDANASDIQHVVKTMSRDLGRRGRGKKKPDTEPVPPIAGRGGAAPSQS